MRTECLPGTAGVPPALEKLVHGSGQLPPDQHYVEITIPNGVRYEMFAVQKAPDWYAESAVSSKAFGDAWQKSKRSLILIVPSPASRRHQSRAPGLSEDLDEPSAAGVVG